ncbi:MULTISPECIES: oxalate decarboxylase family bicupin [Methylorubrum]|jgi:oxalate decarboxylase|uniref:Oxalate decarboxylase n=2 Tax=Methylorubrum extorquens TaxID=408 RepID=C5B359_METEA|nr:MULTISPECIES: oxalate decarboxylase family bicupin [Methylorubrum]ACS38180.1 oxalate decarboxylase [Methylorubrum extorquens AM1]EHP90531.1 bicupin, oxalate decarboxylase family [Methylorubrum extorquens DSM 13060]MCP1543778.1 oxalate decarboxylase [Methylorubrum extorquens]MCP1588876.1 oxalate decarboxylase [Methylorubrum extorquens]BDL37698.1 oxalate decarboxylase OxdC [Methylorubrum sp. GM97]
MNVFSRRGLIAAAGGVALSAGPARSAEGPSPLRGSKGADILGPRNAPREAEDPFTMAPPKTDHGTMPNLKWSFADSHMRLEEGGWARQTTTRELPISTAMAGVNMRLKANVVREMHWHKEAEWAYMIKGRARITAIDGDGRTFADDVGEGDLWYFPSGIPHSIQGLEGPEDGCEFLLVFDDGGFSEDSTFLITDWLAHTPRDVLAKNFGLPESAFDAIPEKELYIFPGPKPGALADDQLGGTGPVPKRFSHRMLAQEPIRTKGGSVRITDSSIFPASATIAAALVELEPGAMRELHWHPNGDEWQYYLSGRGRMTVFGSESKARSFDYQAGDVGYVPFAMGHYIENTGDTPLTFLEMFRSPRYADISLRQWMALTPHALVQAHTKLDRAAIDALPQTKSPVVPG